MAMNNKPLGTISYIEIKLHIVEKNSDGTSSYVDRSPIEVSLEDFSAMVDKTIDSVEGIAKANIRKLLDREVTEKLEIE